MSSLLDSNGIPVVANEGESLIIQATFFNPDDAQFTKAAITEIEATLLNDTDNSVINGRNNQTVLDANGGVLDIDGSFQLTLNALDNILVDTSARTETHSLILTWTWNDLQGASQTGKEKWTITVANTPSENEVIDPVEPEELDLSGIKRVKTKHMEIEAFDPRIVQEARDRENQTLPCFGESHFCIGVYRRR